MSQTTIDDRYRGVLIGLAAGDRLALLLAESLHNCGGFNAAKNQFGSLFGDGDEKLEHVVDRSGDVSGGIIGVFSI